MPSYSQWLSSANKGQVSKVTWLCGDQRVLVEEVIDKTKNSLDLTEFNYFPLSAESDPAMYIWDTLYQYSIEPDANRLMLVRQADFIVDWSPLEKWLKDSKNFSNSYIIFVSDQPSYPMIQDSQEVQPHIELIRKKGKAVKCSLPSQVEIIEWIKRNSKFSDYSANFLFERCGSDMNAVANVCRKSLLFKSDPGTHIISELTSEYSSQGFADCLIFFNRKAALSELSRLPEGDYAKTVGLLYSRLNVLHTLHRAAPNFNTSRELSEATGVKIFLVTKYVQAAKPYDKAKIDNCRSILTVVDDAIQRGATSGAMELLASLW